MCDSVVRLNTAGFAIMHFSVVIVVVVAAAFFFPDHIPVVLRTSFPEGKM